MVGLVAMGFLEDGSKGYIPLLGVVREHRGRGIGGQLLSFALGRLKQLGVKRVELAVDLNNLPAVRLYSRAGFGVTRVYDIYRAGPSLLSSSHATGGRKPL
ncbi:MAG: hypothetical protein DRJ67_06555 [Thermoprotei archaeon]|nr:MAG: hypothetical protein DRJ67_06555 [Thermoprotei archaeon]